MAASPASMGGDRNLRAGANKPGLLTLTIKDKSALYLAYMPFVKNGGLFIPTNSNYRLGDEVFMLLNLMGEDEKLPVAGRVIWVSSPSRTAARPRRRSRPILPVRCPATRRRTPCRAAVAAGSSRPAASLDP
jgi:type IV pilus assembly protein PilZ